MDKKISHAEATALEYIVRSVFNCERFGVMGVADRPKQNERMQRSSAPVSNSSCSGFFNFFKNTLRNALPAILYMRD